MRNHILSLLVIFIFSTCDAVNVQTVMPIKDGVEAAVIIAPGENIDATAYVPLAKTLQNITSLRLWVVLLDDFEDGKVTPLQLSQSVAMAMTQLGQTGFKSDAVFLAGHGLGGIICGSYSVNLGIKIKGVLLFSAYITKEDSLSLKDYPVPVLTISGDLDGLTRITRIVDIFEDLEANVKTNAAYMYKTPVIVVPGIAHAQFASGKMPSNVIQNDLYPEADDQSAKKLISEYSNAFMLAALNVTDHMTSSLILLEYGYNTTKEILTPLSKMKSLDLNNNQLSLWSVEAQSMIVNASDKIMMQTTTKIVNDKLLDFYFPSLDYKDDVASIQTVTAIVMPDNSDDFSPDPLSPVELKVKMKSQGAVQKDLPNTKFGKSPKCKTINMQAFNMALGVSSALANHRYKSRGRPIRFGEDTETSVGPIWISENLSLAYDKSGLNVTAARLHTGVNVVIPQFAGSTYCTLLSPYRAIEWIYIDSLKYTKP